MTDAAAGWTEERVALLGRLWSDGLSASQIATILGGGVTRNAVIGKVHRLGLAGRSKTAPSATPRPPTKGKPPTPLAGEEDAERPVPVATLAAVPATAQPAEVAIPVSERVTILELRDSMCRWPLGDPTSADFGFCGGRAVIGLPYCGAHCRVAFQPAADRKRVRSF